MSVKLPRALIGFVAGPIRFEKCGGEEFFDEANRLLLFEESEPLRSGYAVTHLQKKSRFGFLLMWPLCFHAWFTFRYQKVAEGINPPYYIPGSECVLYWRVGWTRWDAGDCKYVMGWTRQILGKKITIPFGTWYGPGLHWD